jgi:hypothetical protein
MTIWGIMATPMDNAHAPVTSHQTVAQEPGESFLGLFGIQTMKIYMGLD